MGKKRIEIIITVLLILILIFAWANSIKILKKRAGGKTGSPGPLSSVSILKPIPIEIEKEKKHEEEKLVWVRDPFSGKIYSSIEGIQNLKLMGIIWDETAPLAMINDEIVRIGDRVDGNRIVDIKPDKVILNDGIKEFELKLK